MKYIVSTIPIMNYYFDKSKYKLIYLLPSIRNEVNVIHKYGVSNYLTNFYLYSKLKNDFSLFDILIHKQNELCTITDATHFILVNCSVIINRSVISHCKKNKLTC